MTSTDASYSRYSTPARTIPASSRDISSVDTKDWDVIVVGSGLGRLSTAAYLATNDMRTLVLEQHDIIGGCSQVFRRKNRYEFDAGVHYLGDCQPGGLIPTVLRGVGLEGRVEFLPMDRDGHDTLLFPDLTFRMPVGWDHYLERLVELFPDERDKLACCVDELQRVADMLERLWAPRAKHPILDAARRPRSLARFTRAGLVTLAEFLHGYAISERARAVLSAPVFYVGVTPATAPAVTLAFLLMHFLKSGGYYPRGGSQVLAASLVETMRAHGGAVRTKARVEKILVSHGRVQGVRLATGEIYWAPVVVSNADVKRTYLDLVGSEHLRAATVKRVAKWRMSAPVFSVYLAVDLNLTNIMLRTNYWILPSYDLESMASPIDTNRTTAAEVGTLDHIAPAENLAVWITSASVKDPDGHVLESGGHSTVELIIPFPDDKAFWGLLDTLPANGEKYQKNREYLRLKQALTERVIRATTKAFPDIEGHIVWQEASTPVTHERYTMATGGAWAGVALSSGQLLRRPRSRTEIRGLFMSGASTVYGPGVVGTLRGGVATASAILGRNLWREIQTGCVFGNPSQLTPVGPDWDPFAASKGFAKKRGRIPRVCPTPTPDEETARSDVQ